MPLDTNLTEESAPFANPSEQRVYLFLFVIGQSPSTLWKRQTVFRENKASPFCANFDFS
jgi:hypothetical protein